VAEAAVLCATSRDEIDLDELEEDLAVAAEQARSLRDSELKWRIAAARGRAHALCGDDETALVHLARAVREIEGWRTRITAPGLLTHLLRERGDPYREAAFAAARLGRAGEAVYYSELLRARVYFEMRARELELPALPVDESVTEIRRRIASLEFRLREGFAELAPDDRRALHEEIDRAEYELDGALLMTELAGAPAFAVVGHRRCTGQIALRSRLAPAGLDSSLAFLVDREHTLAFHLTGDAVRMEILPAGRERLHHLVERLRLPMERLRGGELDLVHLDFDVAAARELYRLLVAPFARELGERVAIVPDDCLTSLPFELLVSGGEPGAVQPTRPFAHLAELEYLGIERRLTCSASLCIPARIAPAPEPELTVFVAPAALGVASAADEVAAIRRSSGLELRLVEEATARSFTQRAPQAGMLHLIAHGVFDAAHPLQGYLTLGSGRAGMGARLEAWQIESLSLDAELTVLSGCHTAQGSWYAGEGLVGMTRSFLVAGSQAVVASLWAVEDGATARMMERFYFYLGSGCEADEALSLARADVLQSTDARGFSLAHPWFWAGWVLYR
jgi:hypothetical protein